MAAAVVLQPGTPIAVENIVETEWPENIPLEGMIEYKEDVVGHVPIYPVAAKEPVLKRDLASPASFGLSSKIPNGMRATAVRTSEVSNVAGFIFPGSRVDVLITLRGVDNSTITRTVLQNMQVLSTGTKTAPDPNGKPENVTVVTLLATPEESEKLVLAQTLGSIHFVLRNGADMAVTDTPSVDMSELAGTPKKVEEPAGRRVKRVAVVKAPAEYAVETVSGGKTTVAKFPAQGPE